MVRFTSHLKRFFPDLADGEEVTGSTVADVVRAVDGRYPGIAAYVVDERGALRRHVNVFVDGAMVSDRDQLTDPVGAGTEVYFMQALSGG